MIGGLRLDLTVCVSWFIAFRAGRPDCVSATVIIGCFISSRAYQQPRTLYISRRLMVRPLLAGSGLVPANVANAASSR